MGLGIRIVLGSLLIAAGMAAAHGAPASSKPVALKFVPCQIGAADSPLHLQAECTSLSVPENYAEPQGKHIRLHIALLKARNGHPAADPLFFITGGPGEAASDAYPLEAPAFDDIRARRNIVLVDQRGTGQSNALNCPAVSRSMAAPTAAQITQQTLVCLKQLPGDPHFYTTTVAVKDLDSVRQALGDEEINLYGVSYGTRVALQYLREFPQHTRSVILDGVVPPDWNVGETTAQDAQQALAGIFQRCAAEQACHKAFPHLPTVFSKLEQSLKQHPLSVAFRDPLTGAPRTAKLDWQSAAGAVQLLSYQSETAALLPLLIHQAGVAHDYVPLMANAEYLSDQVSSTIAIGMHAAVLCTEDVPFYKPGAAAPASLADTFLGAAPIKMLIESCAHWPRGVLAPDFKKPVVSAKPVLLLSGEDDPITPPANAAHVAHTLSNSLSLIVPGQGHGNAFRGCIPELMTKFIQQASVKQLDSACVKTIKPFPFFTSFTGPGP